MSTEVTPADGTVPNKKIKMNGGSPFQDADGTAHNAGMHYEPDSSSDTKRISDGDYDGTHSNDREASGLVMSADAQLHKSPFLHLDDLEPSTSSGATGEPLHAMLECVEAQYIDEKTNRQIECIELEVKEQPLVAAKEELSVLREEYYDPVYIEKLDNLESKYRWLRRTRGDGNCFYRSLGFSLFENLMNSHDRDKQERFKSFMTECKEGLITLNYPKVTIEDFLDTFLNSFDTVMATPNEETILDIFQTSGTSEFVVVWLRFLTVLQLQRDPDFYSNFIENHDNIVDFCRSEVEPMYRESDHIHIIAIATLLNVKVRVEYMDRGGNGVVSHDFPESDAEPEIFMLYRPGHYDIVYKN